MTTETRPSRAETVLGWIARLVVVGIFALGAIPKFTGNAVALAEKLPGGGAAVIGIGIVEIAALALILVPRTAFYGAALAGAVMLGAVASHVLGPVGMEGDFASMFIMAIVALVASAGAFMIEIRARRRRT